MNRQLEDEAERAWRSLPSHLRNTIEGDLRIRREDLSAEELIEVVISYVGPRLAQARHTRILREEADRIKQDVQRDVQYALEHMQNQYQQFLTHIAVLMERLTALRESSRPEHVFIEAQKQEQKYLPPQLSYTNCIRHHPPSEQFPAGRPGPERCVLTIPQEDGIHMRCLVAYVSQNPDDQGFARLPYQIFHAQLLREGGCPRPLSRSITRRIPGISWLFTKPDICPLASGEEIVIEYGKK